MARSVLLEIFRVGTGAPSGVPRPVVKEDDMGTRGGHRGRGDDVVARSFEKLKPAAFYAFAVFEHAAHGSLSAFLHASA